jgi:uncharacterized protein (TIRG00374 family)
MESNKEKEKEVNQDIEQSLTISKVFNQKTIKKGVIYFIIITLITLTAIFLYTNTGKTLKIWSELMPQYLLIALGLAFLDLYIGGWRNHIFAREYVKDISQWVCFRANLANIFMGAVTPSQTGGGPAQWYVLYRHGLKVPELVSISVINFMSTMIFFPLSGYLAYLVLKDRLDQDMVVHIIRVCFIVFAIMSTLSFSAIIFPRAVGKIFHSIGNFLHKIKPNWKEKIQNFGVKAQKSLIAWQKQSWILLTTKPWLLLYSFILTVLLYLNKYLIAYIIVLAFGYEADILVIISIQAIVYFLSYFAPSPGASGIAEISQVTMMAAVLASDYLTSFTFLYRSILVFLPAIIGAFVVIGQLNKETKE